MTSVNAILFFFVALVYSSAGFGGGSMYLAILAQSSLGETIVRLTGLTCNAAVTLVGSANFIRHGWVIWKPVLQLLACSVPAAVFASTIELSGSTYFVTLGICLLVAAVAMIVTNGKLHASESKTPVNRWYMFPASALIGFVSGMTGIGGGVYLSPVLYLTSWGSPKHIAATSSLFILINSLASLIVPLTKNIGELNSDILYYLIAVVAGGLIGSNLSSSIFRQTHVRLVTVAIIMFASIRILYKHLIV